MCLPDSSSLLLQIFFPVEMSNVDVVKITTDIFGETVNHKTKKSEPVIRYTLKNRHITVQVITYGATITSVQTYDKNGILDDIVLGFDDMKGEVIFFIIVAYDRDLHFGNLGAR